MTNNGIPFYTRDNYNYFHDVGKVYPETNIAASNQNLFLSIFDERKSYVIQKVLNSESIEQIQGISLKLYRSGCTLVLGVEFVTEDEQLSFTSYLPLSTRKLLSAVASYPESEELYEFEFHFIKAQTNELIRVVQAIPLSADFVISLVAEFKTNLSERYNDAQFSEYLIRFLSDADKQKYCIAQTVGTITKGEPTERDATMHLNHVGHQQSVA